MEQQQQSRQVRPYQQQYPQNPHYRRGTPIMRKKRRRRILLSIMIPIGIVVTIAAAFLVLFLFARITMKNNENVSYYTIGPDQVPSIQLALGSNENRKITGFSTETLFNGTIKSFTFADSGASDGMDLLSYAMFLVENDDFEFLEDGDFSKSTGSGIQLARNSINGGYMVVVEFNWKPWVYEIKLMRSRGTLTGNTSR
jgi:hypothetical protein